MSSLPVRRVSIALVASVAVLFLLALAGLPFLVRSYTVPSGSMRPALSPGDHILVTPSSYWFGRHPQRGDVVVFKAPRGWLSGSGGDGKLVKRVIGVPGDTVMCCDSSGRLEVNGTAIDETAYALPFDNSFGPMAGPSWTSGVVPHGTLFVMGDDRGQSADSSFHLCPPSPTACSRSAAFVSETLVIGKVFAKGRMPHDFAIGRRPPALSRLR